MTTNTRAAAFGWLIVLTLARAHAFQNAAAPQRSASERVALERVALGDARAALHEAVCKLPLKDQLTVGAWAMRDVGLDRALRAWTRAQPAGSAARFYSDQVCEIDLQFKPDEFVRQLIAFREQFEKAVAADGPSAAEISAAGKSWSAFWIGGVADRADARNPTAADGWENVSAEGVQAAKLAAAADAAHALLDDAARLKVTAARRLYEFLDSAPEIRPFVLEAVSTAAETSIECAPDQVACATLKLRIADFIRLLIEAHTKHYRGDLFQAADFREMALTVGRNELTATGLATPPERFRLKPEFELIDQDVPTWAEKSLTSAGRYQPADGDDFPLAMRVDLARWDAMDQLRKQVESLRVQGDVTVEQLQGYHRGLKDDVVIFLSGARLSANPNAAADGSVTVSAELPLRRLWLIVRRSATIKELDPPASQPTSRSSELERTP